MLCTSVLGWVGIIIILPTLDISEANKESWVDDFVSVFLVWEGDILTTSTIESASNDDIRLHRIRLDRSWGFSRNRYVLHYQ